MKTKNRKSETIWSNSIPTRTELEMALLLRKEKG